MSGVAVTSQRFMNVQTNNECLRELVEASGLSMAVALTIFNRGLGKHAVSVSRWKAFLAEPGVAAYAPLDDALLAHARAKFAPLLIAPAAT
jgi:hypothetical protein